MNPFLQKLLTEGKDTVPALLKRLRGEAIEPEVVGDLATIAKKKVLADVPGELVGQKLLSAPTQNMVPSIASNVDDVLEEVVPFTREKKGLMDHFNDLSTTKKVGLGAAATGAALMPLMSDESTEFDYSPVDRTVKTPVKTEQNPLQSVTTKSAVSGKKSVVDNALQNQAPEIEALSKQEDTLNNELEEARRKDAEQGLLFGLLKAGQAGGAAIAGSKADTSFADEQLKKDDRFVERLKVDKEYKEQAEKRDPNSQISKLMQQSILALKPGANVEGLSAAQVEKIFPSLAQAINMQEAIISRKEQAQLNREEMSLRKSEKKDQKLDETANKHIDTYTKMLYKDYQGVQQAETNAKRAEDVVAQNIAGVTPGAGDIAILYNFIKGLDKNSAVREGEIALSKQARSVLGRLDSEIKRFSGGDLLDKDTRSAFAELIKASAQAEKMNFVKQKRNAIAAGKEKGIDTEVLNRGLFGDISTESAQNSTTIPKSAVPEKVRIRNSTTGQEKTVDAATAQQILKNPNYQAVK